VATHISQYSAGLEGLDLIPGTRKIFSYPSQDLDWSLGQTELLSNGGKRQGPEASAEVKNVWSCTSTFLILLHEVVQQLYLFTSYVQH
jgi:hypothetical protein